MNTSTDVSKALSEIKPIFPWFDKGFRSWVYSNPLYPIECKGTTAEEVIEKYSKNLASFIESQASIKKNIQMIEIPLGIILKFKQQIEEFEIPLGLILSAKYV